MPYSQLIARHRQLPSQVALELAPTLANLLEGRLTESATLSYLRELELEEEFENVIGTRALQA